MSKQNKLNSPGFLGYWMLEFAILTTEKANSTPFARVQLCVLLQIRTGEEQDAVLLLDYLMQN